MSVPELGRYLSSCSKVRPAYFADNFDLAGCLREQSPPTSGGLGGLPINGPAVKHDPKRLESKSDSLPSVSRYFLDIDPHRQMHSGNFGVPQLNMAAMFLNPPPPQPPSPLASVATGAAKYVTRSTRLARCLLRTRDQHLGKA